MEISEEIESTMLNKPYIKILEDKVLKFNRSFIKVGEPYKMSFTVEDMKYSPPMWFFIQTIVSFFAFANKKRNPLSML